VRKAVLVSQDNFFLIPEIIVPQILIEKNGANIELTFQREEGQSYSFQQSVDATSWADLTGHTELLGVGVYTATDAIAGQKFYNVVTGEYYTDIPDIGAP
jgi:hypothetical protein